MNIDWSSIRYVFQIPLRWFKDISNRVYKAYGTNFITVQEGIYGGTEIGIDEDLFNKQIDTSLGGVVRSVNGEAPDSQGNVNAGTVKSVNGYVPDAAGNVEVEEIDAVKTVNGKAPVAGNVDVGTVTSVNGNLPDAAGNVTINTIVKTVDHKSPDATGNIQLNAIRTINGHNGNSEGEFSGVVTSVNGYTPDSEGNVEIEAIDAVKTVNGKAPVAGNVNVGTVTSVNGNLPDAAGNVEIEEIDAVKTVNGELPDENGNVDVGTVKTVNGEEPDQNGNVDVGTVKSVDGIPPDNTGDVPLLAVRSINDYTPDQNGNVEINLVEKVDGHAPDSTGAVSFGLLADKWVKTDSNGHLITQTNEIPVTSTISSHGYAYLDHGTLQYKDEQYVNLSTDQEVKGMKTWKDIAMFDDVVKISPPNSSIDASGITMFVAESGHASINMNGTPAQGASISLGRGLVDLNPATISKTPSGSMQLYDTTNITLAAPTDQATLATPPTGANVMAIATVGYVDNIAGKVKSVNGKFPDDNGNISVDCYTKEETDDKLSGYVTLTTTQDISGTKRFGSGNFVVKTRSVAGDANNYAYIKIDSTDGEPIARVIGGTSNGTNHAIYVRGYAGSNIWSGINCSTDGTTFSQRLENEPIEDTTSTTALQIASRGWTNKHFIRKNENAKGVLYTENGNITYKDDYVEESDLTSYYTKDEIDSNYYTKTQGDGRYVTLSTAQVISGAKSFTANPTARQGATFRTVANYADGQDFYQTQYYDTNEGHHIGAIVFGGATDGAHTFRIRSYNGSTFSGILLKTASDGTNEQLLENEPNRLYSQGNNAQIATRGYCRLNFAKAVHDHGYVKYNGKLTHTWHNPSDDSFLVVVDPTTNLICRAPLKSILPGGTSGEITTDKITDWANATKDFATKSELEDYATVQELEDYATKSELEDYATQAELTAYAKTEDLNDYAKTEDLRDYVKVPNATPYNGNVTYVSDVSWNGTSIVISKTQLRFVNGIMVGTQSATGSTISTVAYSST